MLGVNLPGLLRSAATKGKSGGRELGRYLMQVGRWMIVING